MATPTQPIIRSTSRSAVPPLTTITDAQYQAIPTGLTYFADGMIVQDSPGGQISIVHGGVKELVGDGDPNPANNPVYQSMGAAVDDDHR